LHSLCIVLTGRGIFIVGVDLELLQKAVQATFGVLDCPVAVDFRIGVGFFCLQERKEPFILI